MMKTMVFMVLVAIAIFRVVVRGGTGRFAHRGQIFRIVRADQVLFVPNGLHVHAARAGEEIIVLK